MPKCAFRDFHISTLKNLWAYLNRAHLKLALDRTDVTIGRQAVTFVKAYDRPPADQWLLLPAGWVALRQLAGAVDRVVSGMGFCRDRGLGAVLHQPD